MKINKHIKLAYYEGEEGLEIHKNPVHKKKLICTIFGIFLSTISFFVFTSGIAFIIVISTFVSGLIYGAYLSNFMVTPCCKVRSPRVTLEQPDSPALYECKSCKKLWSGFIVDHSGGGAD